MDHIRTTVNTIFLVDFFNAINPSPLQYKICMTIFLIVLIVIVKILINFVIPTNNAFLISCIVAWIEMMILIIVLLCDTKSNSLSKTVYDKTMR